MIKNLRPTLWAVFFLGCSIPATKIESDVKQVIREQESAWNRGDIEAFMAGYENSPDLTFASGGNITTGWQETLDRYKKGYDNAEKMGRLVFSQLQVYVLSPDSALVLGKWELERKADHPWGLFTLLFRKKAQGWRIVLDHTSSAKT